MTMRFNPDIYIEGFKVKGSKVIFEGYLLEHGNTLEKKSSLKV